MDGFHSCFCFYRGGREAMATQNGEKSDIFIFMT